MAILVDEARWPWRGTTWCHLVTDSHLEELHDFARLLGCRRIGFQGDHYDIDVDTRSRALTLGAAPATSREVVRRLRTARLRLRPSQFRKWELVERWSRPVAGVDVERELRAHHDLAPIDLDAVVPAIGGAEGAFLVRRESAAAFVVHGHGDRPDVGEEPARGIYSRIDHRGFWGIEVTSDPLLPSQ